MIDAQIIADIIVPFLSAFSKVGKEEASKTLLEKALEEFTKGSAQAAGKELVTMFSNIASHPPTSDKNPPPLAIAFQIEDYIGRMLENADDAHEVANRWESLQNLYIAYMQTLGYPKLEELLRAQQWKAADEQTQFVMVNIAQTQHRNYLEDNEYATFSCTHIYRLDKYWTQYSKGRFGFSVQTRIWHDADCNFIKFGERVGWRLGWLNSFLLLPGWKDDTKLTFKLTAPHGHLPAWCYWDGSVGQRGAGVRYGIRDPVLEPLLLFRNAENRIQSFFSWLESDCKLR